jgi:hypothetical protein
MSRLYKIEFVDKEPWCRCDGELATPEWCIQNFGIEGEPEINKDYILSCDTLYIKKSKNNFYTLLTIFGDYREAPKYDYISNKGYGSTQASVLEDIYGDGCFVVHNVQQLKELVIKDYSQFKKDYPKFNKQKYLKFMKSLDKFYKDLRFKLKLL